MHNAVFDREKKCVDLLNENAFDIFIAVQKRLFIIYRHQMSAAIFFTFQNEFHVLLNDFWHVYPE